MEVFQRNKSDFILALLFIESVILSSVTDKPGFFWFFFIILAVTSLYYSLTEFRVDIQHLFKSNVRNDILLITLVTVAFNANTIIFANKLFSIVVFVIYYIGLRYLARILSRGVKSQIQRNALNLTVLFSIFLGSNILVNLYLVAGRGVEAIILLFFIASVFFMTYTLAHYSFIKERVTLKWARVYSLTLAILLSEAALVSSFYVEKYPALYRGEGSEGLSITTTALFLTVIYYSLYGLMIHKINKKFHPKAILEYVSIAAIIIITLFLTVKWFRG